MARARGFALLCSLLAATGCASDPQDPGAGGADAKILRKDTGAHPDAEGPLVDGHVPGPVDSGILDAFFPDAIVTADRDRDGLPDDEDPDPGVANALLFQDTFEIDQGSWLFTSVGMRIDPGQSLLTVPQVEPFVRLGWLGPRTWEDVYIRGLVKVNRLGNSGQTGSGRIALMGRARQVAPARFVLCGVDLNNGRVFISEHDGGGPSGTTLASVATTAQPDTWLQLGLSIRGNTLICTFGADQVTAMSSRYTSGSAGFWAFDASFEADWFEVYER